MPAKSEAAKEQRRERLKVAHIVQEYINSLQHGDLTHIPQPRHTPEQIRERIAKIKEEFALATGVRKVDLAKMQRILEDQLMYKESTIDPELTARFTAIVKQYSEWKGHTAADWIAVGVPRSVLRDAQMLPPVRVAKNTAGSQKTTRRANSAKAAV